MKTEVYPAERLPHDINQITIRTGTNDSMDLFI